MISSEFDMQPHATPADTGCNFRYEGIAATHNQTEFAVEWDISFDNRW